MYSNPHKSKGWRLAILSSLYPPENDQIFGQEKWTNIDSRVAENEFRMILLMEEILHQLIGSLSDYLQGFIHPGGAGFLPSTVLPRLAIFGVSLDSHSSQGVMGGYPAGNGYISYLGKRKKNIFKTSTYLGCGTYVSSQEGTPPKTNMEPENDGF